MKLHFYKRIGEHYTNKADAEGDGIEAIAVPALTKGSVTDGIYYKVIQGQKKPGKIYKCMKSAGKGGSTSFNLSDAHKNLIGLDEKSRRVARVLREAVLAAQKTVTIEIDLGALEGLKGANYRLCFATKIAEGDYNVIWKSYKKYGPTTTFSWIPQYQLFGSNVFQDQVCVTTTTNVMSIGLGETSVLDQYEILGEPYTGGEDTAITLVNEYGSIHPGLMQISTGSDGEQISTPSYIATQAMVQGTATLTPVEKVLVWFEQDVETATMFSTARSNSVEIDLSASDSETRVYTKNETWEVPEASGV